MRITFVSLSRDIETSVKRWFPEPEITAIRRNITQCEGHDCVVSPGNSFGLMDGGIDRAIVSMFSTIEDRNRIMTEVRKIVLYRYSGEQPVGTSVILATNSSKFPFLAHSPTMRIPGNCEGTLNAYYAFKATLDSIKFYNRRNPDRKIESVLTTTFCTGAGEVPLEESLRQMRLAYDNVIKSPETELVSWKTAHKIDSKLQDLS